eukprot:5046711-Prymnesium_polylepis.1
MFAAPVSEPPRVRDAYAKSRGKAVLLAAPVACELNDQGGQVFMVESSAGGALNAHASSSHLGDGFKWPVSLSKFLQGDYEGACGCGRSASSFALCQHAMRCVVATRRADALLFRKPWQTTRQWESQVGGRWGAPRAQDVLEAVHSLRVTGILILDLAEP